MESEVVHDIKNPPIANFIDGYAFGWRFAIRESFRDALDITWASRITNKVNAEGQSVKSKDYVWTQGKKFRFNRGDVIYDTRLAYELKCSDALQHIKLFIQITEATPSALESIDNITDIQYGSVEFKLYRPLKDLSGIEEIDQIECTQADFVTFLQTGIIITSDKKHRNLFQEYEA